MPVNLKELFFFITKFNCNNGGIYALSMDSLEDPNIPFQMKVGRTTDYKDRLNSYHLCYNAGYRMICSS